MKRLNLNLWEKVKIVCSSSDHAFNPPLFFSLIFLLPTQFGRHFWFPFSYVHGLRLDYLSPTLYITDILIVSLFIHLLFRTRHEILVTLHRLFSHSDSLVRHVSSRSLFIVAMLSLIIINCVFSQSPLLSLYGWVKVSEFVFFLWYAYSFCKNDYRFIWCIRIFLLGIGVQAVLAVLQYHAGGSLGGMWYFLGERFYTGDTPGVANATIFGQLWLRPYGTLPHPNILAAFLLIGWYFLLFTKNLISKKLFWYVVITGSLLFGSALIITLSRTALVLILPLLFFFLFQYVSKRAATLIVVTGAILLLSIFPLLLGRFGTVSLTDESVITREFFITASFKIIRTYPLTGTGLFSFLPVLGKEFPAISYDRLQPVHAVPLLMTSELGIPASVILLSCCGYGIYLLIKKKIVISLLLAFLIVMLSLVDHYFWTLQQGQLLLSFLLAVLFIQYRKSDKKIDKTTISNAKKRKI